MPNVVLKCGSFNPVKRAEALARADELGATVRALTSEDVLGCKGTHPETTETPFIRRPSNGA